MRKIKVLIPVSFVLLLTGPAFAADSAEGLHSGYDRILRTFVSNGRVDYPGLKKNRQPLDSYLGALARVSESEFNAWKHDRQLAYLINFYNAATLQLIIDRYPVKSIKDIGGIFKGPWDRPVVDLFGKKITLDTLEHDIIRKRYREPRIHMALVCAAKGCPPLRGSAYTAEGLDGQLNEQTRAFLASPSGMRLDQSKGRLYLSSIFKWYKEDFPSVLAFVEKHTNRKLTGLTVEYIDYDWSLNEQEEAS